MTDFRPRTNVVQRGTGRLLTQYKSVQRAPLASAGLRGDVHVTGDIVIIDTVVPYLSPTIQIPYVWTFNTRTGAEEIILNEGEGSGDAFLIPVNGPAYASAGGLTGDYVTAVTAGSAARYFETQQGLSEITGNAGGDLSTPFTVAFVFKPTKSNSGNAILGYVPHGSFNPSQVVTLSYTSGSPTQCVVSGVTLTGLVWGEWNVLFVNNAGSWNYALNLGASSGGASALGSADGSPLVVMMGSDPAHQTPFDDEVDTVALYTDSANDNSVWTLDRPQIYARIMARQRLANLPAPTPPSGDPLFSHVVLLAHMDSSAFVDSSTRAHTAVARGAPTNPAGLYGNALGLDGSSGIEFDASNDWKLARDYTIEGAFYLTAPHPDGVDSELVGTYATSSAGVWYVGINNLVTAGAPHVTFYVALDASDLLDGLIPAPHYGRWVRWSVTRAGDNIYMHVEDAGGVMQNVAQVTGAPSLAFAGSRTLGIGKYADNRVAGYFAGGKIDEVRITPYARYGPSTRAAPTGPFPNS